VLNSKQIFRVLPRKSFNTSQRKAAIKNIQLAAVFQVLQISPTPWPGDAWHMTAATELFRNY